MRKCTRCFFFLAGERLERVKDLHNIGVLLLPECKAA